MSTPTAASKLLAEWFWTDRWIGSSAFLLPMEPRGLYREMLTQAWRRGAQLPNNPETIRRAVGATEGEWSRCWDLVRPFWREENGILVNDTQIEVYGETKRRADAQTERSEKANAARWRK